MTCLKVSSSLLCEKLSLQGTKSFPLFLLYPSDQSLLRNSQSTAMATPQRLLHSLATRVPLAYSRVGVQPHHLQAIAVAATLTLSAVSLACISTSSTVDNKRKHGGNKDTVNTSWVTSLLYAQFNTSHKRCECEVIPPHPTLSSTAPSPDPSPKPLSRLTLLLYKSKLISYSSLPVPRLLTPRDPIFSYPELKRGLRRRQHDESSLQRILSSPKLKDARAKQDQQSLNAILEQMNACVYGEGVTPQLREDFLIQYGCTGHTPEILEYLQKIGEARGFIEVGAGNGQWARALNDCNNGFCEKADSGKSPSLQNMKRKWEFILAYDNMANLPLSPQIYHRKTLPVQRFFYDGVRRCTSHVDAVEGYASRGRVLLLVYPPPGSMAVETVEAYANANSKNDTVVFVGEGRGGANANDELFDYLLGIDGESKEETNTTIKKQWALMKVMDVRPSPGGKGYEKLFVFQRVR